MILLLLVCMPFEIPRVLLLTAIGIACSYETCINIEKDLGIKVKAWVLYAYNAALCILALTHCGIMAYYSLFIFAVCIALFSCMINKEISAKGTMYTLASLAYPCFPMSYIIIISVSHRWAQAIALGLVSCMVCDAFALFGGMLFGRHKVAPDISPNKTIEGCISGAVFSLLAGILVWWLSRYYMPIPLIPCLVTAFVSSTAGQIGDLVESMLKRYFGIKDMSNLIPGHGGVMDRVDSSLFAIPAAYFCLYAFGL